MAVMSCHPPRVEPRISSVVSNRSNHRAIGQLVKLIHQLIPKQVIASRRIYSFRYFHVHSSEYAFKLCYVRCQLTILRKYVSLIGRLN